MCTVGVMSDDRQSIRAWSWRTRAATTRKPVHQGNVCQGRTCQETRLLKLFRWEQSPPMRCDGGLAGPPARPSLRLDMTASPRFPKYRRVRSDRRRPYLRPSPWRARQTAGRLRSGRWVVLPSGRDPALREESNSTPPGAGKPRAASWRRVPSVQRQGHRNEPNDRLPRPLRRQHERAPFSFAVIFRRHPAEKPPRSRRAANLQECRCPEPDGAAAGNQVCAP